MATLFRFMRGSVFMTTMVAVMAAVALNFLILTSSALVGVMGGLINAVGMSTAMDATLEALDREKTKNRQLEADRNAHRKRMASFKTSMKKVNDRVVRRTMIGVGRNVASFPAELVPMLGVAVVTGNVVLDVSDGCETMSDIDGLYQDLGIEPDYGDYEQQCVEWGQTVAKAKATAEAGIVDISDKLDDLLGNGEDNDFVASDSDKLLDNIADQDSKSVYDDAVDSTSQEIESAMSTLKSLLKRSG